MERDEIAEKIVQIIHDNLSVDKEKITEESRFVEDLKADSLDIVELAMELEDSFDLNIPEEDLQKIFTVGDTITYIQKAW